jgi:2,4-dienoyl-CoA reductase (NADPH2)
MLPEIGKDIGLSTRWCFMQDLQIHGVNVLTSSKVLEITSEGVVVETSEGKRLIKADTVVVATGARPNREIETVLQELNIPYHIVGDASKIGKAFDAIHGGFDAGRTI